MKDAIIVKGARLHNLKNITVQIPKNSLTVVTGLSGSGKSSLAFDTIYAEGQRRYVESLSTYARQFLQLMEKPDVDSIEGLSPAISIDQKTAPRNPRSTVGTVTEIYDYLRLLFAKIGHPNCYKCGKPIARQTATQIVEHIANLEEGMKIILLAPIVRDRKGSHEKALEKMKKEGFVRVRIDGEIFSVVDMPTLDEKKKHSIEIVVDRLVVKEFGRQVKKLSSGEEIELPNPARTRLADSVETALKYGEGMMGVMNHDTGKVEIYSENFSCTDCGISLPEIAPRSFSFNSPHGACEECHGLGTKLKIDPDLVMPNKNLTLAEGAIMPWSATTSHLSWYNKILEKVAKANGFSMHTPISKLDEKAIEIILYGADGSSSFEGVIPNLERRYLETDSDYVRKKIEQYMQILICPVCNGKRLRPEVLAVKVQERSIIDVTELSVLHAKDFFI
ncbi:excinuclease ABC subunit A, partial [Candidatus Peregrinibacteria bacterium CG11_big_fil_rev_8_21_14_0_20_46_8]